MVEYRLPKPVVRVRSPLPAPYICPISCRFLADGIAGRCFAHRFGSNPIGAKIIIKRGDIQCTKTRR